jgi:hypothetical protein
MIMAAHPMSYAQRSYGTVMGKAADFERASRSHGCFGIERILIGLPKHKIACIGFRIAKSFCYNRASQRP